MRAPNGLEVMVGDIWSILGQSDDKPVCMLVLCFDVWEENEHAFCKTLRLNSQTKVFLGFTGEPWNYKLISRVDDHS